MSYVRCLVKCKLNSNEKDRLLKDLKSGSLAIGKIFYEGMQAALRGATIDENNVVQFIEVCYCLEAVDCAPHFIRSISVLIRKKIV
jgi:hypothetical protein